MPNVNDKLATIMQGIDNVSPESRAQFVSDALAAAGLVIVQQVTTQDIIAVANQLPQQLPNYLIKELNGYLHEDQYRAMRTRHVDDEVLAVDRVYGGSWLRMIATWLYNAELYDPPYGSRHHMHGIYARIVDHYAKTIK